MSIGGRKKSFAEKRRYYHERNMRLYGRDAGPFFRGGPGLRTLTAGKPVSLGRAFEVFVRYSSGTRNVLNVFWERPLDSMLSDPFGELGMGAMKAGDRRIAAAALGSAGAVERLVGIERVVSASNSDRAVAALESSGIGLEDVARTLKELLGAFRVVCNREGEITEKVPDYPTRQRAADMAMRVFGGYFEAKKVDGPSISVGEVRVLNDMRTMTDIDQARLEIEVRRILGVEMGRV